MTVNEKINELWNSKQKKYDDYYVTDEKGNIISSFYFGETFDSKDSKEILEKPSNIIKDIMTKNEFGHTVLKILVSRN